MSVLFFTHNVSNALTTVFHSASVPLNIITLKEWQNEKADASIDVAKIESLIALRKAARENKDWAESDRIRDELASMNVVIKDSKEGTTWEIK